MNKNLIFNFSILFILLGCDEAADCINRDKARLSDGIPVGKLNEDYSAKISGSVNNNVNDDSFDYYFSIKGDFPAGIEKYYDEEYIVIEGVPTEIGEFEFTVYLEVINPGHITDTNPEIDEDEDELCDETAKRKYTFVVSE